MSADDFNRINPNTLTCPVFRSRMDADLTRKIYQQVPVLVREARGDKPERNSWGISFRQGLFNMTSDSKSFYESKAADRLPLYEAKMTNMFDHRAGSYEGRIDGRGYRVLPSPQIEQYADPNYSVIPFYWVSVDEVKTRLPEKWTHNWLLVFKDVTSVTNERTVIATVIPLSGVGHTAPIIFSIIEPSKYAALLANLNSIVLDYVARQKIGGLHLTYWNVVN